MYTFKDLANYLREEEEVYYLHKLRELYQMDEYFRKVVDSSPSAERMCNLIMENII